ncbi:hypothetical protein EDC01DRAFT_636824 [Geopyxis carbonaria]|nr:hypothetical protein EDC01DRAFT_636824 [Geopyxis carbonaria]
MRPPTPRERFAQALSSGAAVLPPSTTTRSLLAALLAIAAKAPAKPGTGTTATNADTTGRGHDKSEPAKAKPRFVVPRARQWPPLTPAQMRDHAFILHRAAAMAAKKRREEAERAEKRDGRAQVAERAPPGGVATV